LLFWQVNKTQVNQLAQAMLISSVLDVTKVKVMLVITTPVITSSCYFEADCTGEKFGIFGFAISGSSD